MLLTSTSMDVLSLLQLMGKSKLSQRLDDLSEDVRTASTTRHAFCYKTDKETRSLPDGLTGADRSLEPALIIL